MIHQIYIYIHRVFHSGMRVNQGQHHLQIVVENITKRHQDIYWIWTFMKSKLIEINWHEYFLLVNTGQSGIDLIKWWLAICFSYKRFISVESLNLGTFSFHFHEFPDLVKVLIPYFKSFSQNLMVIRAFTSRISIWKTL